MPTVDKLLNENVQLKKKLVFKDEEIHVRDEEIRLKNEEIRSKNEDFDVLEEKYSSMKKLWLYFFKWKTTTIVKLTF